MLLLVLLISCYVLLGIKIYKEFNINADYVFRSMATVAIAALFGTMVF